MAEGMGFEPMSPFSQTKRLAGARTRPLCDPSSAVYMLSNGYVTSNSRACARPGPVHSPIRRLDFTAERAESAENSLFFSAISAPQR